MNINTIFKVLCFRCCFTSFVKNKFGLKIVVFALFSFTFSLSLMAQSLMDTTIISSTKKIFAGNTGQFSFGSYGEAHYNAPVESGKFRNGTADLHRVILFMGYKFTEKLQFFSEIEFEHAKEVFVEQAFISYKFNSAFNLKTGVILIPMGYVNEFHEPTLFNGVERPVVDKVVIPTTWRELGLGFHGLVKAANIKYQLYVVNGFKGYDGSAKFSGSEGLRSARQKASKTTVKTPSLTGKVTFYGINGLHVGLAGYYGKSETSLYDNLDTDDTDGVANADSTILGISMAAINIEYRIKNIKFRGEGIITSFSNTKEYNSFNGANVGKQIVGFYGELAYEYKLKKKYFPKLIPFVRYENYDTHYKVDADIARNTSYSNEVLTAGVALQLTPGTIFKTDYQWIKTKANQAPTGLFNLGFGYWF